MTIRRARAIARTRATLCAGLIVGAAAGSRAERPALYSLVAQVPRVRPTLAVPGPSVAAPVVIATAHATVAPSRAASQTPDARCVAPTAAMSVVDRAIRSAARRYAIDEALIRAVIHVESAFDPRAVSAKGATGLMQLMPLTARRFGVTDAKDPVQNIHGGAHYLRVLLDLFHGDLRLAVAAYNAGEGAVMKYERRVPPYAETRGYVRLVLERYRELGG